MSTEQHVLDKLDKVYYSLIKVINELSNVNDGIEASSLLSDMWERLDKLSTVAEARLRVLMCTDAVDTPSVGGWELPSWAFDALCGMSDERHPSVAHNAELLIKAAVARMPLLAYTNSVIDWPRLDTVKVEWNIDDEKSLKWIIYPPELLWPGVKVKVYTRKSSRGSLASRYFRTAHQVLNHLKEYAE